MTAPTSYRQPGLVNYASTFEGLGAVSDVATLDSSCFLAACGSVNTGVLDFGQAEFAVWEVSSSGVPSLVDLQAIGAPVADPNSGFAVWALRSLPGGRFLSVWFLEDATFTSYFYAIGGTWSGGSLQVSSPVLIDSYPDLLNQPYPRSIDIVVNPDGDPVIVIGLTQGYDVALLQYSVSGTTVALVDSATTNTASMGTYWGAYNREGGRARETTGGIVNVSGEPITETQSTSFHVGVIGWDLTSFSYYDPGWEPTPFSIYGAGSLFGWDVASASGYDIRIESNLTWLLGASEGINLGWHSGNIPDIYFVSVATLPFSSPRRLIIAAVDSVEYSQLVGIVDLQEGTDIPLPWSHATFTIAPAPSGSEVRSIAQVGDFWALSSATQARIITFVYPEPPRPSMTTDHLRLNQRDDGLGPVGHPRLLAAQGASSRQRQTAPRVGDRNTYF